MPAYRATSAMTESMMPQRTKFVYTRLPMSVTHHPVPANAKSAARASKPATMNITTAAKVSMPGLRVTSAPLILPEIGSLCCAIASPICLWPFWGHALSIALSSSSAISHIQSRRLSFALLHGSFLTYGNLLSLQEGSHHLMECFPGGFPAERAYTQQDHRPMCRPQPFAVLGF